MKLNDIGEEFNLWVESVAIDLCVPRDIPRKDLVDQISAALDSVFDGSEPKYDKIRTELLILLSEARNADD